MAKKAIGFFVVFSLLLTISFVWAQPSPSKVGTTDDDRGTVYNNGSCIDRAPNGTVMCIWGADANHNNSILWTTYDDAFGTWNPAQVLDVGNPGHSTPSLIADANNHFHATWSKDYRIYYAQYDGVQWSTPVQVQKDTLSANKNSIVVDSNGAIWITWLTYYQQDDVDEHRFISHSVDNGASWSDADTLGATVVPGVVTSRFAITHLAAGPNGVLGIAFREKDFDVGSHYQLHFQEYDGASWSTPEMISFFHDSVDCYQASLAYDSQGKCHVAFYTDEKDWPSVDMGQIYYISKDAGGAWSFPVAISADPDGVADYPQIVAGPNDALYVVYFQNTDTGNRNVFAVTSNDGGATWSDALQISASETDMILRSANMGRNIQSAGVGGTSFAGGADIFWLEEDAAEADGNSVYYGRIPWVETTAVESENGITQLVDSYSLSQNYPNPFNPTTRIDFQIKKAGKVQLKIYNTLGEEIATLIDKEMPIGFHNATFDALNLTSGIYFYKLIINDFTSVKKMMLMK